MRTGSDDAESRFSLLLLEASHGLVASHDGGAAPTYDGGAASTWLKRDELRARQKVI